MSGMPKWIIPLIVFTWLGGGIAAYYGLWLPVLLLGGLGILAATSAAGMLWANRGIRRRAQELIESGSPPSVATSAADVNARRRDETHRRQERNRRRRRRQ